jgi:hypothetical protein
MSLDWRVTPLEWLQLDALWCEAAEQARRIWDEEHSAAKKT